MSSENKYYGNIIPLTDGYLGQKDVLLIGGDNMTIEDMSTADLFKFRFSVLSTGSIASLNGLVTSSQTFANDTNVTITSSSSTHTLGWSGTLGITRGGTGQSTALAGFNALSPLTTLGDVLYYTGSNNARLSGNITTIRKFLRQTGTGSVSAAPAWDTILASDIPGSALTRTNDTNVTLTLGGNASTALLNSASLTLGWTGQLSTSRGGTGLGSIGTANQLLRVNSTATALEYFTPSYVENAVTTINGLSYPLQVFSIVNSGSTLGITSSSSIPLTASHSINIPDATDTVNGFVSTSAQIFAGIKTFNSGIIMADSANIAFNATTGTKIGTATTQKLSFWNATPIAQPTTSVSSATLAINSTAQPVYAATTYDGYTTMQVVRALRNIGILA